MMMRALMLCFVVLLIALPMAATATPTAQYEAQTLPDIATLTGISAWHAAGVRGAGVRIGVLDVGFRDIDTLGIAYTAPSQQTPELLNDARSNHGTLVIQVLHALAPDAELVLYQLNPAGSDLAPAVDWFLAQGVTVVNFSAFRLDIPMDGTSFAAQQMGRLVDQGDIAVVTSMGNYGYSFLTDTFRDTNNDGWHEFSDGSRYLTAEALLSNPFGQSHLRWQDTYTGATIDLDIYIFGADGTLLATGLRRQQGGSADWSVEDVLHPTVSGMPVYISIRSKVVGETPSDVVFYLYTDDQRLPLATATGSLTAPADSPKVLAVGGVNADDTLWVRSGRGPTWDGRPKPDLVAPARIDLGAEQFFGTSASAPIVSAGLALLRSALTELTEAQARQWLFDNALDVGEVGIDNFYGYGRIYMPPPAQ